MVNIVEVRDVVVPIRSDIRNAYIDFSTMTVSVVALVTDVAQEGGPVIGFGFNSNGRYAPQGLLRERFIPRLLEAARTDPATLLDESGTNFDPASIWHVLMRNEKPGGHGERSVAVGTLDMAIWDATAKIAQVPLWRLLSDRSSGGDAAPRVFVYAAGGYYYPGAGHSTGRRDAFLPRPRLLGVEDEDRWGVNRRRPAAYRSGRRPSARRGRQPTRG